MTKPKHLWVTALVALCLSVSSGAAFALDSWTVLSESFPTSIEWDVATDASVDAQNDGDTTWDSTYGLLSVEGITAAAVPINRWGLTLVPVVGVTVGPQQDYLFEFSVAGPPITSLKYDPPVSPTEPGVTDSFDCNWILAKDVTPTSATLIATDTAVAPITVSRFPDIQPGTLGGWARFWVEELAGRVPLIVQGFPDGTYRPTVTVTRDQMAVFIARALKLTLPPFQGEFSDVPEGYWARAWIEALVATEIVLGFDDGTYRPTLDVTRDQMAVFMARGIAGGDSLVPTGPSTATFPDVDTGFWAFKYIEYAVDQNVVIGFPDGSYRPLEVVTRDSMAVFIWRSFMMPTGTPVVLAGPANTSVDPGTADYVGWSTIHNGPQADPGFAYVGFDAVRLDSNLVFPKTPTGVWEVTFELVPVGTPTPVASQVFSLTESDIQDAKQAAVDSGDPYLFLSWDLPSGLTPGDYEVVVTVSDETGALFEVPRRAHILIE